MMLIRVSEPGPDGSIRGSPVRSWGGIQEASTQSDGATTEWRKLTPEWKEISSLPNSLFN